MNRKTILLMIVAAACAPAIVHTAPYPVKNPCDAQQQPFFVKPDSVLHLMRTIALFPIGARVVSDPAARARAQTMNPRIASTLILAGFHLAPMGRVDSLWHRQTDSLPGMFDPNTGELDTARANKVWNSFLASVRDSIQADVIFVPVVEGVESRFINGTASWDGVSQGYESFGHSLLRALAKQTETGTTFALSLRIQVQDMHGTQLAQSWGGIQLLSLPKGSTFLRAPDSTLFRDTVRLANAVHVALCPFVTSLQH